MFLEELIRAAKFKVVGGSEFLWDCYGPTARYMDFSSDESTTSVSGVFDIDTQKVYEVCLYPANGKMYRWIDEAFIDAVKQEHETRNIDFASSGDDDKWIDLDNPEDVFRKASQIMEGGNCDDFSTLDLTLEEDLFIHLSLMAHKKDITLNQMVNAILQEALDRENDKTDS